MDYPHTTEFYENVLRWLDNDNRDFVNVHGILTGAVLATLTVPEVDGDGRLVWTYPGSGNSYTYEVLDTGDIEVRSTKPKKQKKYGDIFAAVVAASMYYLNDTNPDDAEYIRIGNVGAEQAMIAIDGIVQTVLTGEGVGPKMTEAQKYAYFAEEGRVYRGASA